MQRERTYTEEVLRTMRAAYSKEHERAQILSKRKERARKIVENYECGR
ncbi:hypothetical protein [Pyrococcus kukulkanii]